MKLTNPEKDQEVDDEGALVEGNLFQFWDCLDPHGADITRSVHARLILLLWFVIGIKNRKAWN